MKRPHRDDGFTLIELVMTVAIMGIIVVPLANFVLAYFDNYQTTEQRLSDSHEIQIATAYVSQDAANTGMHGGAPSYTLQQSAWTSGSYCGQASGQTLVLLMKWDTWQVSGTGSSTTGSSTGPASAAYVTVGTTLHRLYCSSPTASAVDTTLVDNLQSATAYCLDSTSAPASCTTSPPPTRLGLSLTISSGSTDSAAPAHAVILTGQRRQT